ncbi:NADP-dependent 3-hydroxy acid dehydrogenase [Moraxella osloensis]|uniref:SDR family NAD(P)-dependent oxidoreductase n=1 Tax=Moraxella sp. CTOTU49803 TaxID=2953840 RepID=UPI000BA63790|nr:MULTISPECIES: SDR family NAD(P)-dependent oxidoreductase [Moraxella]PAL15695.1 NADP-dependent 3-hydroxy acid dehydrogenase [Moraxella osloensis]
MNILVTGVTAGFGKAIAELLISKGHTVIGTGRRQEKLDELQTQLGDNFIPLNFDISDLPATKTALQTLPSDVLNNLDVLVNNAGLALGLEPADKTDFADWQQMVNTNILGLIHLTHEILPLMVANNDGYIINLSSTAGSYPYFGGNVYGATKAFVTQFSLNLRADLVGKNIRVSNIEPGLCGGTEFSNIRFHGDDAKAAQVYDSVQYVTPQDIANMVAWLIEQPKHVNINRIEVMPTAQTFAGLKVVKDL